MYILSVSRKRRRRGWTVYYIDGFINANGYLEGELKTFVTHNPLKVLWYRFRRFKRQNLNNREF